MLPITHGHILLHFPWVASRLNGYRLVIGSPQRLEKLLVSIHYAFVEETVLGNFVVGGKRYAVNIVQIIHITILPKQVIDYPPLVGETVGKSDGHQRRGVCPLFRSEGCCDPGCTEKQVLLCLL